MATITGGSGSHMNHRSSLVVLDRQADAASHAGVLHLRQIEHGRVRRRLGVVERDAVFVCVVRVVVEVIAARSSFEIAARDMDSDGIDQ